MSLIDRLEALEKNVAELTKPKEPVAEASKDEWDNPELEAEYMGRLTDDLLERFVDGLLITLGEVELEGHIPEIQTPQEAKEALMAVIRRLYIKKSTVAKMSRKFARFGAKRFLQKQRTALSKDVTRRQQ